MKLFNKISNESNSNLKKLTFADGKPVTIQAALAQSVGITRDHMEDAAFSLVLQEGYCEQSKRAGLFIVADGMGGHMNGELASSIAIQKLKENLSPFLFSHQNDESSLEEVRMLGRLQIAQQRSWRRSLAEGQLGSFTDQSGSVSGPCGRFPTLSGKQRWQN